MNKNTERSWIERGWAKVAGILAAAVLVFTFILNVSDIVSLFKKTPKPHVSMRIDSEYPENQCIEFAFERLPEDFTLGKIVLEVEDAKGPDPYTGNQAARILSISRNFELPIEVFTKKKPVEIKANFQSVRPLDAALLKFCPHLKLPGFKGALSVIPKFYSHSGAEIEEWEAKPVDEITIQISYPNNMELIHKRIEFERRD